GLGDPEAPLGPQISRVRRLTDSDRSNPKTATAAASATSAASSAASVAAASAASRGAASRSAASPAASVPAPSAGSSSNPYAAYSGVFLFEDIEGRQANVRDFPLGEDYRRSFMRRYIACWSS